MTRRTVAMLGAGAALTLSVVAACHVTATCDVHRDNSGGCTVTVPPNGAITVTTQTTAPATTHPVTTTPSTPTVTTAPPTSGP